MFNEVQQILQMLLDTAAIGAGLAVGVLAGYAIFKLLTLASFLYFARFVVLKLYDLIKIHIDRPIDNTTNYYFGKHIIESEATNLHEVVLMIRNRGRGEGDLQFIHRSDVEWLRDAIISKRKSEGK